MPQTDTPPAWLPPGTVPTVPGLYVWQDAHPNGTCRCEALYVFEVNGALWYGPNWTDLSRIGFPGRQLQTWGGSFFRVGPIPEPKDDA